MTGGRLGGWAADRGYAAGWRFVRALPPRMAHGAFRLGADIAARRDGRGAQQLRANLARVVPDATAAELDDLMRAGLRSYARYWCEAFRLPSMDPREIHRRMDPHVTGMEPAWEALDQGRGVVFALPHGGNWDMAGVWFVESLRLQGREPVFTTVVERLRPESLYRRFVDYRESLGFEVVAAEAGAAAYRTLMTRLRAGGTVCLVADRDLRGSGATVSFFGEPATFPRGPARLAALTGALLLPAYPHFTADGWALPLAAPITVPDRAGVDKATQAVADAFTGLITRAPADWHMLQPVFTADRVSVVS
ncbi:phosphatidylinositol mannoside acyltransferase [Pseudonocardia asaccharolytica]|uniref:Lipid A biosynthesis lauroyl acyltransferase n=1 Tax=Pseudonocardia asaccharolytica DSM 44247 = NBRC 16224 TaxID=1123024 RepID=A0A511D3D3_9PSEU|nr:phosphatidylinositol mannoside acyltransferase [Pseudonocardia asaccharolytica]GEL18104.1 lipid A biosynthesis lauroyl acyltransferase [Pseudonocardia asaccharolytica DSM 44247 = NBRC 16224]